MDKLVLIFVVIAFAGLFSDLSAIKQKREVLKKASEELTVLLEIEQALLIAVVPDSVKQLSRDASYTLMHAEPDGNDYWNARGQMKASSEWATIYCPACVQLRTMIEEREKIVNDE